ncbi:hypothetical protein [Telmatospirillum sp. J64-1]|uniref:hypothetical protein n=1 Tax=Telmatospirillum sp. J64-1 TaxID=2502183 RepID=UPI00115E5F71|nr:hypothetical protein [Telmatospirillum sp. J64-1]
MFNKQKIAIGDRFQKTGNFQSAVWVVSRIFQLPSEPPHAYLDKEGDSYESLTVSVPALGDPKFFRRLN